MKTIVLAGIPPDVKIKRSMLIERSIQINKFMQQIEELNSLVAALKQVNQERLALMEQYRTDCIRLEQENGILKKRA